MSDGESGTRELAEGKEHISHFENITSKFVRVTSLTADDATSIRQVHLATLHQTLEDARDVGGCLVSLVHHQHVTSLHGVHEWRVFVHDDAIAHGRLECERLYGGVSVKLHVLARSVEEMQEAVDDFILAHTLVAHEQQVLAKQEVLQHVLHHVQVLRVVVEDDVRHFRLRFRVVHINCCRSYSKHSVLDLTCNTTQSRDRYKHQDVIT